MSPGGSSGQWPVFMVDDGQDDRVHSGQENTKLSPREQCDLLKISTGMMHTGKFGQDLGLKGGICKNIHPRKANESTNPYNILS